MSRNNIQYGRKTVVDMLCKRSFPSSPYCEWEVVEVWVKDYKEHVDTLEPGEYHRQDVAFCNKEGFVILGRREESIWVSMRHANIIRIKDLDDTTIFEADGFECAIDHDKVIDSSKNILRNGALVVEFWVHRPHHGSNFFNDPYVPKNTFQQNMLNLLSDEESADIAFKIQGTCNYRFDCKDDETLNYLNVHALFGRREEEEDDTETSVIIYAQLNILKACAPFLASLCEGYSKNLPVPIDNAEPAVFQYMLRYVYGDKIPTQVIRNRPRAFIEIADRFNLKNLKMEAEAWYVKSNLITLENFVEVFLFADRMNCYLLQESTADFIKNNTKELLKSPSFDFVDICKFALQNDHQFLLDAMICLFLNNGEEVMALSGEKIYKSPTLSYTFLSCSVQFHFPKDGECDEIKREHHNFCLDRLRRRCHEEGLDNEGSKKVLVARLDAAVLGWRERK